MGMMITSKFRENARYHVTTQLSWRGGGYTLAGAIISATVQLVMMIWGKPFRKLQGLDFGTEVEGEWSLVTTVPGLNFGSDSSTQTDVIATRPESQVPGALNWRHRKIRKKQVLVLYKGAVGRLTVTSNFFRAIDSANLKEKKHGNGI